jgi:mannosyltransferase
LFVLIRDHGQEAWVQPLAWHDFRDLAWLLAAPGWRAPIAGIALAAAVAAAIRRPRTFAWAWLFVAGWLVMPVVLLVVISVFKPMFVDRYLLFCAPAAALGMAYGLRQIARWTHVWLAVALICAYLTLAAVDGRLTGARTDDVSAAAAWISERHAPAAAIGYDPPLARGWFGYLITTGSSDPLTDIAVRAGATPRETGDLVGREVGPIALQHRLSRVRQLWLVRYDWPTPASPWLAVDGYLRSHFRVVARRWFGEVEVDELAAKDVG